MTEAKKPLLAAIDVGTSSTRLCLFTRSGSCLAQTQVEFDGQTAPRPGWVDHDMERIIGTIEECARALPETVSIDGASDAVPVAGSIAAVGLTNHRETTCAWRRSDGKPLRGAIVWLDSRTEGTVRDCVKRAGGDANAFRAVTGLPLASYFSALKVRWMLDNDEDVARAHADGDLMIGTVDAWIMYRLVGRHATDVTNASRTMLMSLDTLDWDDGMLDFFEIQRGCLPEILSSAERFGVLPAHGDGAALGPLAGVPLSGCLGDQQAALVGQRCFDPGMAKATFGTGAFVLSNTGSSAVQSDAGLITTVAYRFGRDAEPKYALEGSIAVAGAAVTWLRDNLGVISKPSEISERAAEVEDSGGVFFVPAFSGLLAPHWDGSARGTLVGLSQHTNRSHICRATLDAVAYQTAEVVRAMSSGAGVDGARLCVDGGMTASDLLCNTIASATGVPVARAQMAEATALGAAVAAGIAEEIYTDERDAARAIHGGFDEFEPSWTQERRAAGMERWLDAVSRAKGWAKDTD